MTVRDLFLALAEALVLAVSGTAILFLIVVVAP